MFGCGCGAGPIANLRGGGWGQALALLACWAWLAANLWGGAGGKVLQRRPGACHAAQYICTP